MCENIASENLINLGSIMFILLSKSYLFVNELDIKSNDEAQTNRCLVFNLRDNSTAPVALEWPPTIQAASNEEQKCTNKPTSRIICGCISPSQEYVALCDDSKNLVIFNRQFEAIRHFVVKRTCVKLLFKRNERSIFGCDKSGDIYEYDLFASENQEKLLLGHCSMLLDFVMTEDDKHIISCDRDEKIRVTNYPNTYNVLSYCLGHNEFVSSIQLLDSKTLLSGSGDGKMIIWDFQQGKNLFSFSFDCHLSDSSGEKDDKEKSQYPIKSISTDNDRANYLAVTFYNQPLICIFKVIRQSECASLELVDKITLDAEPIWAQFDPAHCNFLWTVSGSKTRPVELFERKQDKIEKAFDTLMVIDRLNEASEHLCAAVEKEQQQNPVDGLFKHYYNNVEMYYKRKQLRIENENNKAKRFI